jgi:hypothetical protein
MATTRRQHRSPISPVRGVRTQQLFDACAAIRRPRRRDGLSNMRPDIVALLYGLTGLVFIAIGIPLALERVPPNH